MNLKDIALERYRIIEPILRRESSVAEISRYRKIAPRTLYNWVKDFKERGLDGLSPKGRNDKGFRRSAEDELVSLITGLYLRVPPMPVKAIHRLVKDVYKRNGWRVPSYDVVHEIISAIPASLKTLAHEGTKAYKQTYGLLNRFEAERPNEIWQSDHCLLDINLIGTNHQPVKPWLTIIIDDYSRAIAGYFLGFQPPSSMRIATALRQGIWFKEEQNWSICGIPEKFYSDCGSDFMSNHIDQISIDLKIEKIETQPGDPQGKGKCERFFRTVQQQLLATLPGYSPKNCINIAPVLTIEQLEQKFKTWLLSEYLVEKHSEINMSPRDRWASFSFVPRIPDSLEQLDLLLMTLAKTRHVRRDGIRFSGFRYFDVALSGYIGEEVSIRYDPRNLAQIHVYFEDTLICRASCYELCGKTVSLKEVWQARNHEAKEQRRLLNDALAVAERLVPTKQPSSKIFQSQDENGIATAEAQKVKIRRFACDKD